MSAGGSDMPGGGCITAGEVRPGRGGGLGGKRRGLLVGGALLQVQLPAAGKGMGPYLAWAERHFSPPEGGLWGPQDKEGEDHSTSSLLLPGLEEKPGCRLGSKLPAAPGHRAFRGAPAGVPCSWPQVTFIRLPTQISSLGVAGPILRQHRLSCPQALEMPHHSPEPPSCNLQKHQPQGSPTLLCGSEGRGVAW